MIVSSASASLILGAIAVTWVALSCGVAVYASGRGHSYWLFLAASLLISPVTMFFVVALMAPKRERAKQPDRLDRLERIVSLRDAGALSAEEFEREKALAYGEASRASEPAPPPPAPGERLDPTAGLLAVAAEALAGVVDGDVLVASYLRAEGLDGEVGEVLSSATGYLWRDPLGQVASGRPRGLLALTDDRLFWSSAETHELEGTALEEVVTLSALPVEALLAARVPGRKRIDVFVDAGPTLRFRLDRGAGADELARHIEARV